jgi:hypothetical protein
MSTNLGEPTIYSKVGGRIVDRRTITNEVRNGQTNVTNNEKVFTITKAKPLINNETHIDPMIVEGTSATANKIVSPRRDTDTQ